MFDDLNQYGKHSDFMSFYGDVCENPHDPIERKLAVLAKKNICFGGGKGGAPDPNPGMLASAQASAEIAAMQKEIATENLNFYKQQYADLKPMLDKITASDLRIQEANEQRAGEYAEYERETFRPLEKGIVQQAEDFDTEGNREKMARAAAADVNTSFDNARSQENRALSRMGVNPNSGRFSALNRSLTLGQAGASAGAMTQARDNAEQLGFARKMDAASLGRNLASNSSGAYGISLAAGQQARVGAQAGTNLMGQGYASSGQQLSGAANSYGTAGNIYGSEYNARMQGYNANQAATGAMYSGIGQIAGMGFGGYAQGLGAAKGLGGAGAAKGLGRADGGVIRKQAIRAADGVHVGRGAVRGPGGPVDDKVPALLSDGEYVLPSDTTKAIGKAKLDKLVAQTHTPAAVQRARKKRKAIKGRK